jgi:hypothetical protein
MTSGHVTSGHACAHKYTDPFSRNVIPRSEVVRAGQVGEEEHKDQEEREEQEEERGG